MAATCSPRAELVTAFFAWLMTAVIWKLPLFPMFTKTRFSFISMYLTRTITCAHKEYGLYDPSLTDTRRVFEFDA